MSDVHEERKLGWGNNPADDIDWCHDRGYRAYCVATTPEIAQPPGLLLTRDTQLVAVAEPGDTLVYDGTLISIRVGGRKELGC